MIAEDIIVKFLAGEAESHEIAFLEQWRRQSEENEKQYRQMARLWEHSGNLDQSRTVDTNAAWNKVNAKISAKQSAKVVPFRRAWMAVAASLIFILGIATWVFFGQGQDTRMMSAVTTGIKMNLDLNDGSHITLMDGEIKYPEKFDGKSRKVEMMKGKAYFDVARDTDRRFEIQCGQSTVTVLGTEFEISYTEEHVQVLVSEGKVLFASPAGETVLTAGMKAEFDINGKRNVTSEKESLNRLVYATGQLEYNEEKLVNIIQDISLYDPNIKIEIDPSMTNCKISGKFNMRNGIKDVLDVIAYTMNASLNASEDGTFKIVGGACQ